MISVENKVDTKVSLPTNLKDSNEQPATSFGELLRGVKDTKDSVIQNGSLILALSSDEKVTSKAINEKDMLLSLLKGDRELSDKEEPLELHPKLTQTLSTKEIKELIVDAKKFLKTQILDSEGFKRAEIQTLPKTLKGLVDLAKKFNIDISKITLEDVKKIGSDVKVDIKQESITKPTESKVEIKNGISKDIEVSSKTKILEEFKVDTKVTNDKNSSPIAKEILNTPLFKAQSQKEHTTEQLVQSKQFKVETTKPKAKADDALKQLLSGDKTSKEIMGVDSKISVATAKVVATSTTEASSSKSFEQLLQGESSSSTTSKTDGLNISKAGAFEVKLNEAKQMIKYISTDIKQAIEDYKSPFTRIKVQLNPQKLGEVDLTIIQRGKNLHVSLSSNTTAITTLSQNMNELRVQLANSGVNNATLNFNDSSQQQQQNQQQQGTNQNSNNSKQQADEEYNYLADDEVNEEISSSLEIVVPRYA